jgi:hypothetical protein
VLQTDRLALAGLVAVATAQPATATVPAVRQTLAAAAVVLLLPLSPARELPETAAAALWSFDMTRPAR